LKNSAVRFDVVPACRPGYLEIDTGNAENDGESEQKKELIFLHRAARL
jgi:hypothetical protein